MSERTDPRPGADPQRPPMGPVQHAHSTVRAARYQRRSGRIHHTDPGRMQADHHSRALSARRQLNKQSVRRPEPSAHPGSRSASTCLAITTMLGLVYLIAALIIHWPSQPRLIWVGLLLIVLTGAIVENAIVLDSAPCGARAARAGAPTASSQ